MSDIEAKVKEMAKLVVYSNKISEMHEKNLKMFPFVFFEGVKAVQIEYDLERVDDVRLDNLHNLSVNRPTNKSFVRYKIDIEDSLNNNLDRRFTAIDTSVKNLFWKNVRVEIIFNDRKVFESKE